MLNAEGYDKEVDMWSVGVITYILLCGFPPFYSESVPEVFEQIMKAEYDYPEEYWDEISAEGLFFFSFSFFFVLKDRKTNFLFCVLTAKDFIDHLLVVDVAKRLTAAQGLNHPWLRQVHLPSLFYFIFLFKGLTYVPSFLPAVFKEKEHPSGQVATEDEQLDSHQKGAIEDPSQERVLNKHSLLLPLLCC